MTTRRGRAPAIADLLPSFYLTLRAGGRAPLTVEWYEHKLERLAAFLGTTPLREVTSDQLRTFLIEIERAGARSATYREGFRGAARTFWRWCIEEEHATRSPLAGIKRIRARPRQLRTLAPADVARLLATQPKSSLGIRNRAIVAFLFDTGVRVGELVTLRTADVDLAGGYALVRGKTGEGRVPMSIELRRALLSYIQRARPRMLPFADPGTLFLGRRGLAMTPSSVNLMLRRAGRAAGIEQIVGPHLFRHTFATEYLRGGGDAFTLQTILRHRTATMTSRYVHIAMSDVEQRHATASPLARLGRRVV